MAAPAAGANHLERRRHSRKNIIDSQLVTVGLPGEGAAQRRGILLDVSEGGMAVQPFVPLTPGTSSGIELQLAGSESPVKGTGLIAWVGPGGRAGVRFIDMPPEAREQLRRFLGVDSPEDSEHAATRAGLCPGEVLSSDPAENEELDLDSALELIAERARDITAATGVAVAIEGSDGLTCRVSSGEAPDVGARLQPNQGLSGYCVRTGELVYCVDALEDPRIDPEVARQLNVRSIVIVPVFVEGRVAGLLEVLSAFPNAFEPRQIVRLQRVADLLSGAIEENCLTPFDVEEAAYPPSEAPLPDAEASEPIAVVPEIVGSRVVSAAAVAAPALVPLSQSLENPVIVPVFAARDLTPGDEMLTEQTAPPSVRVTETPVESAPAPSACTAAAVPALELQPAHDFEFTPVPTAVPNASAATAAKAPARPSRPKKSKKSLPIHRIGPVYLASASGTGGEVVLAATITREGTVDNLRMISGPRRLGDAAIEMVSQWRCQPYEQNGDPIEVETTITIHFTPSK